MPAFEYSWPEMRCTRMRHGVGKSARDVAVVCYFFRRHYTQSSTPGDARFYSVGLLSAAMRDAQSIFSIFYYDADAARERA